MYLNLIVLNAPHGLAVVIIDQIDLILQSLHVLNVLLTSGEQLARLLFKCGERDLLIQHFFHFDAYLLATLSDGGFFRLDF